MRWKVEVSGLVNFLAMKKCFYKEEGLEGEAVGRVERLGVGGEPLNCGLGWNFVVKGAGISLKRRACLWGS